MQDEILNAYLDGALNDDERREFEDALAKDSELQERLDRLQRVDELLVQAFAPGNDVPQHLVSTVYDMPAGPAETRPAETRPAETVSNKKEESIVEPFMSRRSAGQTSEGRRWFPTAIAASIALIVGVGIGGIGAGRFVADTDLREAMILRADAAAIDRDNPLYEALERTPSNTSVALKSSTLQAFIKPILSFASADNRFCREFEISAGTAVSVGVACREADTQWTLEILLAADDRSPDTQAYQPASGYDEEALSAVIGKLMVGPALSLDEEAVLLENSWSS